MKKLCTLKALAYSLSLVAFLSPPSAQAMDPDEPAHVSCAVRAISGMHFKFTFTRSDASDGYTLTSAVDNSSGYTRNVLTRDYTFTSFGFPKVQDLKHVLNRFSAAKGIPVLSLRTNVGGALSQEGIADEENLVSGQTYYFVMGTGE